MKKLIVFGTLLAFLLNLAASIEAQTATRRVVKPQLVSLLPSSDGVVVVDVNRFLNEAMPKLLSGNQPMLAKVSTGIEEMKAKTGLDLREFETVVAGVTAVKVAEKKYDFDAVMIARGRVSAGAVVAAAKLAANGKYREEKIGSKTIFVFSPKEIVDQQSSQAAAKADKLFGDRDMAITVIDPNTIAFGSAPRVRETVEAKSKLGVDVSGLLGKNGSPVMAFAAKVPVGMSVFLPMENDELGRNIDSIKYMYGSMNVIGENTTLHATARTLQNAQAASLKDTLEGLQLLGKAFLGGARGADKQVYARLIENVKFTSAANEVSMDLSIAQSDVDFLVGLLNKQTSGGSVDSPR